MCNCISNAIKTIANSDNTFVMLAAFSTPVVNIAVRKLKEDQGIKNIDAIESSSTGAARVNINKLNQVQAKDRFRNAFLAGMLVQTVIAAACLALAILLPPSAIVAGVSLGAFGLFGASAACSLPAHFILQDGFQVTRSS